MGDYAKGATNDGENAEDEWRIICKDFESPACVISDDHGSIGEWVTWDNMSIYKLVIFELISQKLIK